MMIRYLTVAVLFASAAIISSVQVEAQPPSAANSAKAAADDLALTLCDKPGMIKHIDPITDYIANSLLANDSAAIDINSRYPGLDKRFHDTIRPFVADELERRFPFCVATLSDFYGSKLSVSQIGQITTFMTGATGKILLGISSDNSVRKPVDRPLAGSDDGAAKKQEAINALRKLTPIQQQELERFGNSPAGRVFLSTASQKDEIVARFALWDFPPTFFDQMTQALNAALEAHVASADSGASAAR